MKNILSVIFIFSFFLSVSLGSEPSIFQEDNTMISAMFEELATALKKKDSANALKYFSQKDPEFYDRMEHRINSVLESENPELNLRVQAIDTTVSPVEVLACIESSYDSSNGRVKSGYWVMFQLENAGSGWQIIKEDVRDYAKPRNIDLDVELFPDTGEIAGTATIRYEIILPGEDNLILSLNRGIEINELNDGCGASLAFERTGTLAVIALNHAMKLGEQGEIKLSFQGTLFNESQQWGYSQVGITPEGSFASWVTWWYPILNCETSKCPGNLTFTVPKGVTVVSSGLKTGSETKEDKAIFRFTVSKPLNFSFAAADYTFLTHRIENVDIGAYFLGGDLRNAEEYIRTCSEMISYFIDVYGFYPFDQYAVVEIPKHLVGTLGGSSEQGMNLFPEGMLPSDTMNEYVIAHEIGHSWWGNLVTGGIVQSEVMAQFTATLWFEHKYGEKALRSLLQNGFITNSEQYGDNYLKIIAEKPDYDRMLGKYTAQDTSIVHGLSDMKGHFVMHMLRDQVGQDAFIQGIRTVLTDYAGESISLEELRTVFETVSGQELKWFFDQWLYRTGAPDFTMTSKVEQRGSQFIITGQIDQMGDFFRVRSEIGTLRNGNWETYPVDVVENPQSFELAVPEKPDQVVFDPFYRILRWRPELKLTPELKSIQTLNAVHQSEKALEKLQALLPELTDSYQAKLLQGEIYINLNRLTDAEAAFQSVIDEDKEMATGIFIPEVPRAMLKLGNVYDLQGERDKALKIYQSVIDNPVMVPDFKRRASAYLEKAYEPVAIFSVAEAKLGEYTGDYAIQALVFSVWLNEEGILMAKQKDSPPMTLIPSAADEFSQVGNDAMLIRFLRADGGKIIGIDVFDSGKLMITLNRVES